MIFAEKSRPAFSELFCSPFWLCLHYYVFKSSTGIFGPKKIYVMKYLNEFCRKKPAGIFGIFLFSIRIWQQLLCQQYKCLHFLTFQTSKKDISTQFLQKKAGRHFRNFSILHSDFACTLMFLKVLPAFLDLKKLM